MKIIGIVLIVGLVLFGLKKQLNFGYYYLFIKEKNMLQPSEYIVQYVGFKASFTEEDFLSRWAPFASKFKSLGIISIDLYKNKESNEVTFISRNVWDSKTYFENFPTGAAYSGGGGGIEVIQFGGYWLDKNKLANKEEMKLIFLKNELKIVAENITSQYCSTDKVPYKQVLDVPISFEFPASTPSIKLICKHIKTM